MENVGRVHTSTADRESDEIIRTRLGAGPLLKNLEPRAGRGVRIRLTIRLWVIIQSDTVRYVWTNCRADELAAKVAVLFICDKAYVALS